MSKSKRNYRKSGGCHNCTHCFQHSTYSDGFVACYCTLDAPARPPCGSLLMHEQFARARWEKQSAAWEEWINGREVELWGICDEYAECLCCRKDGEQ